MKDMKNQQELKGLAGARLYTWGTDAEKGNGLWHQIDSMFYGGNVGHATLSLSLPANEETKSLIKQYCFDPNIPLEAQVIRQYKAVHHNGTYVKTDEIIGEQKIYDIFFSWFPAKGKPFALKKNLNDDGCAERIGLGKNWDPHWQEYIQPESRYHSGMLGGQKLTYGPLNITHFRDSDDQTIDLFKTIQHSNQTKSDLESLGVLIKKLTNHKAAHEKAALENKNNQKPATIKLSSTEINLIKKLLQEDTPDIVDINSINILLDKANNKETEFKKIAVEARETIDEFKKRELSHVKTQIDQINEQAKLNEEKLKNEIAVIRNKIKSAYEQLKNNQNDAFIAKVLKEVLKQLSQPSTDEQIINKKERIIKLLEALRPHNLVEVDKLLSLLKDEQTLTSSILFDILKSTVQDILDEKLSPIKLLENELKATMDLMRKNINDHNETISILTEKLRTTSKSLAEDPFYVTNKDTFKLNELEHKLDHYRMLFHFFSSQSESLQLDKDPKLGNHHLSELLTWVDPNWKNKLKNAVEISLPEMELLTEILLDESEKLKADLAVQKATYAESKTTNFLENVDQNSHGNYISQGETPDHTVFLPLNKKFNADGHDRGLDVEQMLQKMREIVTSGRRFDLNNYNCSTTVSEILDAGAPADLKGMFTTKALWKYNTPQLTRDNALKYLASLNNPEQSSGRWQYLPNYTFRRPPQEGAEKPDFSLNLEDIGAKEPKGNFEI